MKNSSLSVNAWEVIASAAVRDCPSPAVSVVITLYNYADYIRACLDSVRASDSAGLPGGFEVVVVDDCSVDSSVKVVEEYMAAHALPVWLVKKSANTGLADARNLGLQTARAPLAFILDADNEIRPGCLHAHYHALAASDHAMAYGIINRFDHATRQSLGTMSHHDWDVRRLVAGPCIDAMAMVRRETVLRLGGYSPEYGTILPQGWEDYDLWLKLAQAGLSGKRIPQVLSDYRVHSHSMIKDAWPAQREFAAYFSRKFHLLVRAHDDLPEYFGTSRQELALANGQGGWLQARAPESPRLVHRLLGKKLCRSLCKRLSSVYWWLRP